MEGSNNGKSWTIITDTSLRNVDNPGAGSEPLQGTYRYVKVLLHNAKSENVAADQLDTLPYKAMFNPMQNVSYSVTEIADILIYSDGEGEPTPDIFVATNIPADDPVPETTEVTEAATDVVTGTVTDAPADSAVESTGDTPSEKTGCTSVLNGMTLAVVTVAGTVVCAHRRKEN